MYAVEGQKIEGFPSEKMNVSCAKGDNVCGNVQIPPMAPHWFYAWNGELEKATGWLMARLATSFVERKDSLLVPEDIIS
jgi:hypothetical protein